MSDESTGQAIVADVDEAAAPSVHPTLVAAAAEGLSSDHFGGPDGLARAFPGRTLSLATRTVHADDYVASHRAIAPPLHVSTTFRYSRDPERLVQWENLDVSLEMDRQLVVGFFFWKEGGRVGRRGAGFSRLVRHATPEQLELHGRRGRC